MFLNKDLTATIEINVLYPQFDKALIYNWLVVERGGESTSHWMSLQSRGDGLRVAMYMCVSRDG